MSKFTISTNPVIWLVAVLNSLPVLWITTAPRRLGKIFRETGELITACQPRNNFCNGSITEPRTEWTARFWQWFSDPLWDSIGSVNRTATSIPWLLLRVSAFRFPLSLCPNRYCRRGATQRNEITIWLSGPLKSVAPLRRHLCGLIKNSNEIDWRLQFNSHLTSKPTFANKIGA